MSHASPSSNSPTNGLKLPPWLIIVIVLGFLGVAWYQNRPKNEVAQKHNPPARQQPGREFDASRDLAQGPTTNSPRETTPDDGGRDEPVLAEVTPERDNTPSRDVSPRTTATSPAKTTTTDRSPQQTRAGPGTSTTDRTAPDRGSSPKSPTQPTNDPRKADSDKTNPATTAKLENQTIRDFGKVVFKGTIDLQPTLDRIARGDRNTHRNDGSTFGNRERRLPQKPSGYYTEYVHQTKGINGPGPQRVIVGKGGDIWYTPDHYETFKKIK